MEYEIDDLDRQIIKLLSKDGRRPFADIANRLEVTEKTIRSRYRNLIEKDILNVVGVINPIAVGLKTGAIILIKSPPIKITSVIDKLKEIKKIRYITLVSGDYPILVQIAVPDHEKIVAVLEEIALIPDVTEYNAILQLEVHKNTFEYI
ncbi:Lrp/AsnC family transcriptional regulator [Virgibacillus sp. 179-BFC.A HS]|uniref:Lrp/AsnC family transcriptional regulator n=1 Tax=Tigheibacillus jepli TaxID=3035914 RepID=A0ABU5CEN2_9BACI|nr:Lrp/AsnC family transcriptional regulator [Virgibacillus sp. 179-BFC.A HS]MDY0404797.1 Lrp/AsnC family transcriptional regulator [Virgibacillus sp. 179-BFC.A HS]